MPADAGTHAADSTPLQPPWRERRAVFAIGLLALGYLLAASGELPGVPGWVPLIAGGVSALGALWLRGWWCRAALCLAVIALAFGWFRARCEHAPADALSRVLSEEPSLIRVLGAATGTPTYDPPETDPLDPLERRAASPWRFEVRVEGVADGPESAAPASGLLRVRAAFAPEGVRAGTRVIVRGFARAPPSMMNPGEPDRARLARQEGVAGTMLVPAPEFIEVAPAGDGGVIGPARGAWWAARERLRAAALRALAPGDQAHDPRRAESVALLGAMLLGHREDELRDLSGAFTRVGLAHVLSVSGMNLTLLAAFALYAVRLLGDRPRLEKAAVGALLAAYLMVVPAEAPIVRAALMIGVFLAAEWGGRRYDRVNTLAWAAVISLLWRPMDLWSAGFQLSYVGVASLIVLARPVRERMFGARPEDDALGGGLRGLLLRGFEALKTALAVTTCTWLATAPLVLVHTGVVSLIGPVANLVVWPLVTVITGAGYALVLAGTIAPGLSGWVTPALHHVGGALAWTVRGLDLVPGAALHLPRVGPAWCVAATALVCWWALRQRPALPTREQRRRAALWTLGAAALLFAWLALEVRLRPTLRAGAVEVAVLHLPGGSCTVVRSGRGALLYDAGAAWAGAGRRAIPQALRALGVASVPTAVISHADLARFNALPDLVRPLGVREVVVSGQFVRAAEDREGGAAANLLARLREMGVAVREAAAGDVMDFGGTRARVLAPARGALMGTHRDGSIILGVEFPGTGGAGGAGEIGGAGGAGGAEEPLAVVLMGDVGREGFEALHGRVPSLAARVVVMPRAGWAGRRPEEVARWATGGRGAPVVIQPDAERAEEVAGLTVLSTRERGCVRVRLLRGAPPEVTPFRGPAGRSSAASGAPSPSP